MKIYKVKVNGKTYRVELESVTEVASESVTEVKKEEPKAVVSTGEGQEVLAPLQGGVCAIKVSVGQKVKKGDVLLLIEAMKLENEVVAEFSGVVKSIAVSKGTAVQNGQVLVVIG